MKLTKEILKEYEKRLLTQLIFLILQTLGLKIVADKTSPKKFKLTYDTNNTNSLFALFVQTVKNIEDITNKELKIFSMILKNTKNYLMDIAQEILRESMRELESKYHEQTIKNKEIFKNKEELDKFFKKTKREAIKKRKYRLKQVLWSQGNGLINSINAVKFARIAQDFGVQDPSVFFVVVKDERNHEATLRLHLMPDQITPRVWKLSDLNFGYYKKGDTRPSLFGTHPRCRCRLALLLPGYGFKNGKLIYIKKGYDEYKNQREKLK